MVASTNHNHIDTQQQEEPARRSRYSGDELGYHRLQRARLDFAESVFTAFRLRVTYDGKTTPAGEAVPFTHPVSELPFLMLPKR